MPAKVKSGEKNVAEPKRKGGRPRKSERETRPGNTNLKPIVSPKTSRAYHVSSRGEVLRVLANGKHQPVKPWFSGPYECVYIYGVEGVKNKYGRKKCYIHKLVAEHFLKKQPGRTFVHHKNSKERDNNVSNLAYVTLEENLKARKFFYKDEKGKIQRKKKGVKSKDAPK